MEAELDRERRINAALLEVSLALGTTLDLDQLLELILRKTAELLEADRAILYLLDEGRGELVSRVVVGGAVHSIRLRVGEGIAGQVARTGDPVRVRAADRRRTRERRDILPGYRARSILAVAMRNHVGRTIGVMQVLNKGRARDFTDDDEALLQALATQAAVSIDNSRLFLSVIQKNSQLLDTKAQLERRIRDLKLLFDLESATARATSIEELSRAVLGVTIGACGAEAGGMLLGDEATGDLKLYVARDGRPDRIETVPAKAGEGLVARAMQHGEVVLLADARKDPRFAGRLNEVAGLGVRSALAVPIEGPDGGWVGAVALYNKRDVESFVEEDVALVRLIAANTSTALQLFRSREKREREERLSTIGSLLSSVMHDLKTPMTVISGYVQLMAGVSTDARRPEYADLVLKQLDLISAMQREVLQFARGERSLLVRKVYLRAFFETFEEQIRREIGDRPVDLVVEVDDRGVARFDEAKVARALHNLVRNAIEAMGDRGGRLTVGVRREGNDVVVWVSDTGPGIPVEVRGKLFEAFSTAGKKGGTGLGLAVVKKIAEEHGGRVTADSTSKGATFRMVLPQE